MKVFVGIPCPEELRELAYQVGKKIEGVNGCVVQRDEDLQLTIIPPWEEKDPDAVVRDFAAIASSPFGLTITGVGYGSDENTPELAWIVGERDESVDRLWLQTWRALWSQDPPRPAFPYITVAYFTPGAVLPPLVLDEHVTATVKAVALYEVLGNHQYRIIASKMLQG